MAFLPAEFIRSRKRGEPVSRQDIEIFIRGYVSGEIPDYQVAAWLMAVCFKPLSSQETAWLTEAMANSGRRLKFESPRGLSVDKHSTGGVGDKTSMILAPIVAAAGVHVPMMAGRGLGHTGGTLD
ncbi:MAG: thymidine phosphorylase, partial [Verrucomicrobiota bacterium]